MLVLYENIITREREDGIKLSVCGNHARATVTLELSRACARDRRKRQEASDARAYLKLLRGELPLRAALLEIPPD